MGSDTVVLAVKCWLICSSIGTYIDNILTLLIYAIYVMFHHIEFDSAWLNNSLELISTPTMLYDMHQLHGVTIKMSIS
jgi:hypothetical protein